MRATVEGLIGNWRLCLDYAGQAERIFRNECIGAAWERTTVSSYVFSSRTMLGDWTTNAAEMPAFLDQARSRGDLYAEVTVSLVSGAYIQYLVEGRPDDAENVILERLASWPGRDFDIQRLYALQGLVNLDLYRGNPDRAWKRICDAWQVVERSGLLRLTLIDVFTEEARARAAIALAAQGSAGRQGHLAAARNVARRLMRCKAKYACGLAHMLNAGIASVEGDLTTARKHLRDAESGLKRAQLIPWLAVARLSLSSFSQDAESQQMYEAGMAWMNAQQIRKPACLARMLYPSQSLRMH
jgi:hypothetical protein